MSKRISLTLQDIFDIPTAELYSAAAYKNATSVSIDSRAIKKQALFVAIKGERFDGHAFVKDAMNKGASAAVVNKSSFDQFENDDFPLVAVDDTTKALADIAAIWRDKCNAKIIGITGSSGKTTTKDMLTTICGERFKTISTKANDNNHIGVPLTLLSIKGSDEVAVVEHGTNHFGEIAYTSAVSRPDIAFITNIGESHLEYLIDLKGVRKEKEALLKHTKEQGGRVLINTDDKMLRALVKKYPDAITYGFSNDASIKGEIVERFNDGRFTLQVAAKRRALQITSPVAGEHNAQNLLAAIAVALQLGVTKSEIISATGKLKASKNRFQIMNFKTFDLINDTYNANPASMKAAFSMMKQLKKKRSIAILGDMFELGEYSEKHHRALAASIKKNKIDEVYMIGKAMKYLSDELTGAIDVVKHCRTRKQLQNIIQKLELMDSVVLVKGSRGMQMEEFVPLLTEKESK